MSKNLYKELGDAVGMPDEQDKRAIQDILLNYEAEHPGEVKQLKDYGRLHSKAGENDFGVVNKGAGGKYLMELPPELFEQLENYIPTLFREKRHFQWFCKNFKELLIPEKY